MSAQGTYRFYSVQRQTILLVNGEPLGREGVNIIIIITNVITIIILIQKALVLWCWLN